ncbi:MAG: C45 family autoproteolytic acyltransferase/hydrolase, partial [Planctomycetota bacterium]
MGLRNILVIAIIFVSQWLCALAPVSADQPADLEQSLRPLLQCLTGGRNRFLVTADFHVKIDGKFQRVEGRLVRYDDQQFDLALTHADYAVDLRRRTDQTTFALPLHGTVFVGTGTVPDEDHLAPLDATARLVGSGSMVSIYSLLLQNDNASSMINALSGLAKLKYDEAKSHWRVGDDGTIRFSDNGSKIQWDIGDSRGALTIGQPESIANADWSDYKRVVIEREELERQLVRGTRRALEILAPSPMLRSPAQVARQVPHGELRYQGGQRVALLWGTPEQIGRAHGELLAKEARRCIDSVLYAFGTIQTIRTGRWFRHDLDNAYAKLSPHIPEDHKVETRALATTLAMNTDLVESLNVFPELFHCSGFAIFGHATKNGKLYHGRVLDYMTTIGLQDAATTFIIAVDGKIPFANVGYAGFIGSVTGMNDASISLGEMGGGGEGQWDGVPMATLMRRALEECSTLKEVKELWRTSP